MSEVNITRTQVIVVGEVGTNSYGDLTFTDKEGHQYKVSKSRRQYFDKTIIPDMAVQLNYADNPHKKGEEYICGAVLVKDKLTAPHAPETVTVPSVKIPPTPPASTPLPPPPTNWTEKDKITRKSIERQTALNASVELAKILGADKISTEKILATAKVFEVFLETGQTSKSPLVEAAKKLGATEEKGGT